MLLNKWCGVIFIGLSLIECDGREPFKPRGGSLPYFVYFISRYRGMCQGTLVSRTAVLTAAVCVTNPLLPGALKPDTRSINIVTGTSYRHPRRGIRVQIQKIVLPKWPFDEEEEGESYLMQKSPALLLMLRKVPDVLCENPPRPLEVSYRGETELRLQEECLTAGWHFFYRGDKIYPVHKFLLQRNIRAQFLSIAKISTWCESLVIKLQSALDNLGFDGVFDPEALICTRDTEKYAQPCHGMYGASLICNARVVGIMTSPDAQWTNCTGFSNVFHSLSHKYLRNFMTCISRVFLVEEPIEWSELKARLLVESEDHYELTDLYDKMISQSSSSE